MEYLNTPPIRRALAEGLAEPVDDLAPEFEESYSKLALCPSGSAVDWSAYPLASTIDSHPGIDTFLVRIKMGLAGTHPSLTPLNLTAVLI